MLMPALTIEDEVEIPYDVQTLAGFRRWYAALGEESRLRAAFVAGDVFLEMSPHRIRTHAPVVTEINYTLIGLTKLAGAGKYYQPPTWITCEEAGFSTEPDGFFVRSDRLRAGAVRINPEREVELLGRPDFVFEAVSTSSGRKDLVLLRERYAAGGVPEYWLVDARTEQPALTILVLGADGAYHPQPPQEDGFAASPTWGRAFRLRPFVDASCGLPDVEVQVREV